jgi:putative chitinase
MAQFSHECGAGTEMAENINYTAKRACQVWPSRFRSEADCFATVGSSAGDPDFRIKLIDNVYGGRNGNRPGTHDGSAYIGRGLSQVTGRGNYEALGAKVGLDLVNKPDLVKAPAAAPGESRVLNNGVPKIEERRIPAVSGPHPRNSDNRR